MNKLRSLKNPQNYSKAVKKSICAWCNNVIGIFPIDNDFSIISHGICKSCFEKCLTKMKNTSVET